MLANLIPPWQRAVGVGAGAITDGTAITRTGPSSTVPTTVEWLGGLGGVIESGTLGASFARTNWNNDPAIPWSYSNGRVLSRTKVLLADNQPLNDGRLTYYFDNGAAGVSQEYYSCNYYWDIGVASAVQWKIRRLMPNNDNTTDAILPSWYTARYIAGPGSFVNHWSTGETGTDSTSADYPSGAWFRFESFTTISSPAGTANGIIRIKTTNLSTGANIMDFTLSSKIIRGTGDPVDRYTCLQNYLGNETPASTPLKVNMEDIYISSVSSGSGAFVRAELCNNAVYASATIRRICKINSIVGTSWNVTLNGPTTIFGSNLAGNYLALDPGDGSAPTMVAV